MATTKISNMDKSLVPNQSDTQQALTVTNGAAVQLSAFHASTTYIQLYVHGDTHVRFDGTDPTTTATAQAILVDGTAPIWNVATANAAKFIAPTASNTTIIAQGFSE